MNLVDLARFVLLNAIGKGAEKSTKCLPGGVAEKDLTRRIVFVDKGVKEWVQIVR